MKVRTRVAPSPTGDPHVGTAYMALFCLAHAKSHGGEFVLRIEDTDAARSTPESEQQIFDSLRWLGLDWDGEPISQFERADRHAEVARAMLENGKAYKCFASPDEITAFRETADGALQSEGLDFWIDQELRIEPPLAHDKVSATRLGVRLINQLVLVGGVASSERVVAPDGTGLVMRPSRNGKFVRVWRE